MKSLSITIYPNPILKKQAHEIAEIPQGLHSFVSSMIAAMDAHEGVGLAAPQVGQGWQIIVVKDGAKNHAFLNPRIIKTSGQKETDEEGCLSLPGIFLKVKRAKRVWVSAQTPKGKRVTVSASGLGARIFQHEIDHLEGKLIIDRITPWRRFHLRKKLRSLSH